MPRLAVLLLCALLTLVSGPVVADANRCLSECTPRIGIVSAFGAEADILLKETQAKRVWTIHGKRFTTGSLRGHRVVIVLSGVSMINAALVTQQLIDHFRVERLVMSGIAGGIDPAHHVGDVTVPDRWAMPMEVYWNADERIPAPCGSEAANVGCLGLKLASGPDGRPLPSFSLPSPQGGRVPTGLFMRENFVLDAATAPRGEFRFDYPVDSEMLAVARGMAPSLQRCGPRAKGADGAIDPKLCVAETPRLIVGGRGVSGTAFLANPHYRAYLAEQLQAQTVDMETAALAHVALTNGVPYIAFRSLSDLAGATEFNADVGALFASGLAESNEAAVTLAFLDAWKKPAPAARGGRSRR
jgi:adenosylhomocysteine nucleosidase